MLALTCVEKTLKRKDSRWLKEKIRDAIKRASDRIVKSQMNDSTFGENVVTAALASQVIRGKGGRGGVALVLYTLSNERKYCKG